MNTLRIKNALWGAFISDSMSMPVHWYYRRKYIKEGFQEGHMKGIMKYEDAPLSLLWWVCITIRTLLRQKS